MNARPSARRLPVGLVVLALVAALGLGLWASGGLRRAGRTEALRVGQRLDLGPATITITGAQATKGYDGKGWIVRAVGQCTVSDHDGFDLAMISDDFFALATTTTPRRAGTNNVVTYGSAPVFAPHRDFLGPDLAPQTCNLQAEMPEGFNPADGIRVVISDLAYGDDSITGDQDEHWYADSSAHRIDSMPVDVVDGF